MSGRTGMIAVIPARSGSKGLKDKNIRMLNGKPLLAYSVEAAIQSGLFDTVHVSTDSQAYAQTAIAWGAEVPFLRDSSNAQDHSSSWDVVREVLEKYKKRDEEFNTVVLLQPTSPLRTAEDIRAAFDFYQVCRARTLTSVTEVEHPVQWCFPLDETRSMDGFAHSPYRNARRQELRKHYRENGAIYIVRTSDIVAPDFDFYQSGCVAFLMDQSRSADIDVLADFAAAEAIMKMQKERRG